MTLIEPMDTGMLVWTMTCSISDVYNKSKEGRNQGISGSSLNDKYL